MSQIQTMIRMMSLSIVQSADDELTNKSVESAFHTWIDHCPRSATANTFVYEFLFVAVVINRFYHHFYNVNVVTRCMVVLIKLWHHNFWEIHAGPASNLGSVSWYVNLCLPYLRDYSELEEKLGICDCLRVPFYRLVDSEVTSWTTRTGRGERVDGPTSPCGGR